MILSSLKNTIPEQTCVPAFAVDPVLGGFRVKALIGGRARVRVAGGVHWVGQVVGVGNVGILGMVVVLVGIVVGILGILVDLVSLDQGGW